MAWWFDPISLVFVIGSSCGAISAFLALSCSNMRMSRCKNISICCGFCSCIRENLSETEFAEELENQQKQAGALQSAKPAESSPSI